MILTKDDQLLQAASTGNNHHLTTLLTTRTPSPALIQQMLTKAIYPNAHLPILTTLFTHFFQAPISEEPIRSSCYQGSNPISSALAAQDPHVYTGSFNDEKGTPMVLAVQSRQSCEFLSFFVGERGGSVFASWKVCADFSGGCYYVSGSFGCGCCVGGLGG